MFTALLSLIVGCDTSVTISNLQASDFNSQRSVGSTAHPWCLGTIKPLAPIVFLTRPSRLPNRNLTIRPLWSSPSPCATAIDITGSGEARLVPRGRRHLQDPVVALGVDDGADSRGRGRPAWTVRPTGASTLRRAVTASPERLSSPMCIWCVSPGCTSAPARKYVPFLVDQLKAANLTSDVASRPHGCIARSPSCL